MAITSGSAILILRSAAVCEAPAAARGYTEALGDVRTCCGWSRRHSRAPGQNENCCFRLVLDDMRLQDLLYEHNGRQDVQEIGEGRKDQLDEAQLAG